MSNGQQHTSSSTQYIYAQKCKGENESESNLIAEINSQDEKNYKSEAKQENKKAEMNTNEYFNCEHCDYKYKKQGILRRSTPGKWLKNNLY